MTEFLELLNCFDVRGLFLVSTTNGFLQFIRYVLVGGIATVVDWSLLFFLTSVCGVYHLISAVASFSAGLITNYALSKRLVFKANKTKVTVLVEFVSYAIIGVIGLGITELILVVFTNEMNIHYMISKALATITVLAWNYIARKNILYK